MTGGRDVRVDASVSTGVTGAVRDAAEVERERAHAAAVQAALVLANGLL